MTDGLVMRREIWNTGMRRGGTAYDDGVGDWRDALVSREHRPDSPIRG